jgi:beta-galactosidase
MKDQYNALNPQRQPGPLAAALGAKVGQYYALDHSVPLSGRYIAPIPNPLADIWAEAITPSSPDTHKDVMYTDPNGWLDGQAAMVSRAVGKGTIAYLGTLPEPPAMYSLLDNLADKSGSPYGFTPSDQMEITMRGQGSSLVYIVINHGEKPGHTAFYGRFRDLLSSSKLYPLYLPGAVPSTRIDLPPQGIAVLIPETAN